VKKAGSPPDIEHITVKFAYIPLKQILAIIYYFYGKRRFNIRLHFTADGSNLRNGNPRTTVAIVVEPSREEVIGMHSKEVLMVLLIIIFRPICLFPNRKKRGNASVPAMSSIPNVHLRCTLQC
jgi:hypothetical protein